MTHGEVVAEILGRAAQRGVLGHYCPDSRRCEGDRGLPDVLLVGPFGAAWVEVKTGAAQLKPAQTTWKHMLLAAGQRYEVMREEDLTDGGLLNPLLLFLSEGIAP